ncbi:beta-ketoacyl synthase [Chryseobacterium sp. StRB126]|uniref:beta-ketoacyl synthase N-terminal-like domain-containing protein n=1 Tax=Chryseobacterium sp. StRB126 TaxID=878220 RepID=UPI0004E990B3|nr:beta-ketoacyl synthase N-terminal-like domain-containing protein [Chryseobacterium sp. StRB126]BAP31985.1 beta-ketoacyl synthase [Chryseobacterium sp. StRB126]
MMQTNSKTNIVISAIGFNSSRGTEINEFLNNSGNLTPSSFIIEDHDPQKFLKPKGQRFLNKATLIYCNTAFQSIHNRDLSQYIQDTPERIGLYDGTELSNLEDCFVFDLTAKNQGPDRVSPMKAPSTIANAAASQMAIQTGIKGPNFSVCAGMAGSLQALDIAYLHLKQGIIDYGVIASTEVRNTYQKAIQKKQRNQSPELGISMILERQESLEKDNRKPLAGIRMLHSETYTNDAVPFETYLYETISPLLGVYDVDTIIVSGGVSALNENIFECLFKENDFSIKVLYPENELGDLDNAGGMLGIAYSISIFNGQNAHKTDKKNILVLSVDPSGSVIYTIIEKNNI